MLSRLANGYVMSFSHPLLITKIKKQKAYENKETKGMQKEIKMKETARESENGARE